MIYYIGAGSNEGDSPRTFLKTLTKLKNHLDVLAIAPLMTTPPLLPPDAPESWYKPYLNTVFSVRWQKSEEDLFHLLKSIETKMGRRSDSPRWSPRPLDLDILCTDHGHTYRSELLNIPHSQCLSRSFTLNPLVQLNSQLKIAGTSVLSHIRKSQLTRPYFMAILNCTPDSFATSSQELQTPLETRFLDLLHRHVPFIDLGAESTRPGATPVDPKSEWERLQPLLSLWKEKQQEFPFTKISVDTRHAATAQKALDYGVSILNDVSHLSDPAMREVAKDFSQTIFMHSLSVPAERDKHFSNNINVTEELHKWCLQKLEDFSHIPLHKLIFDPGLGFGKTPFQSLSILKNIDRFKDLPVPLLLGHSRKSFMNLWSPSSFEERDVETIGISLSLYPSPVNILRVHNIFDHERALQAFLNVREFS